MLKSPYFVPSVESTNNLLREMARQEILPEGFVLHTDFQTAGKGQLGNSWESEEGKNLLFSMLLYPYHIPIHEQFILSQITGLAVKKILDNYTDDISIKWSNDVYWKDKKICGILIENSLMRDRIDRCIIGVGVNINQDVFTGNAPNPVSLKQIIGKEVNLQDLQYDISKEILDLYLYADYEDIQQDYRNNLYRNNDFYPYIETATQEPFNARIDNVGADGKLTLITDKDERKEFYFKEVQFVI